MPEPAGQDPSLPDPDEPTGPSDDAAADDDDDLRPRQSPTDMINRNDFLLYRLQGELERLKTEASKTRHGSTRRAPAVDDEEEDDTPDDPTEILERARQQIEALRKKTQRRGKPAGDGPE